VTSRFRICIHRWGATLEIAFCDLKIRFEVAICDLKNIKLDRCSCSVNDSCMSLTSIQEEIARLSSTERAMLIDILWESLDEACAKEIEAKWAAESEDRIDAVDRGELQTLDGPTALRDLRLSLGK